MCSETLISEFSSLHSCALMHELVPFTEVHTSVHVHASMHIYCTAITVADPGFPVGGGVNPLGGVDLQCGCFLAKMYAKMIKLGPIGGHASSTPPRSANALDHW